MTIPIRDDMTASMVPDLSGTATADLVQKIEGGAYAAEYINWARTVHLLHKHAPGWLPYLATDVDGATVHKSGKGGYLMIGFRHTDTGTETPPMPQAIMDNRNAPIDLTRISARDITDTHRRGVCMSAAMTFGLAYELWAKMPLERGYQDPGGATRSKPRPAKGGPILKEAEDAAAGGVDAFAVFWKSLDRGAKGRLRPHTDRLGEIAKAAAVTDAVAVAVAGARAGEIVEAVAVTEDDEPPAVRETGPTSDTDVADALIADIVAAATAEIVGGILTDPAIAHLPVKQRNRITSAASDRSIELTR